jgi:hypothetical protein
MLECVISLETFPFVERQYAELANVPSLALFLVNCINMALPSRILSLAMFTLHSFPEKMFLHITRTSPGGGGPHEAYVGCELMVPVTPSLCLIVIVRPASHL